MNFFYILSGPLGYVMEWIYKLLPNYGWDIILFTLLINIVKIPLQTSQQKSMAKMSAFQPMIAEIQTKYKNKPEKQQEELMKLQQDFGYKPTAGCMPMLLNFLVMFGVIGVVYNPLERIFHISAAALASAGEALTAAGISFTAITRDTNIIAEVVAGNSGVLGCFTAQQIATITEFSQHMNFFGIDLTRIPKLGLSLDIVLPLLSVITVSLLWRHLLGRERRGGTLLLPPAVLRDRFFRAGIIITLLYQLTTASLLLATALVLQSGLGFSPFHTALMHIPFALGAMFSIAVAGRRLSLRLGRNVTLVGVAVQMSGLLLMGYGIAAAPGTLPLTALGLGFGLCGCGMGLISAPLPAFAMAAIPVAHAGAASGLFRTGQQFGAALGMATLGGFYLAQSASAPEAWRGAFITLLTLGALILLAIAALSRLLPASVLPPAGKP